MGHVHDVARRLGIDDEQAQQAVAEALAQYRKEPIGG
jgi:endonuclease III